MTTIDATQAVEDALEAERLRIQREITSYSAPIPACDAYFNHLLERRAAICDALARLRAASPESRAESVRPARLRSKMPASVD